MTDSVEKMNLIAMVMTVDYHKHAVRTLFVGFSEHLETFLCILDAVIADKASVTDQDAGVR